MCWTFFICIWCSCIQPVLMQSTSWDLVTSPAVFGKPVELRCTVAGYALCCSQLTRIWSKGSTTILNNGFPSLPSKYKETIDDANKQFSLIINDLSKEDVDVVYTCAYGNISPQKTLTQNDSFEYHPTESCQVKLDDGELVVTLSVAMSAPYPSVFAQYGDDDFTSYLTTNITPVANSTKFYTINSSLKRKTTCRNDVKFTLSVLTGVTTNNICDNVNLCECWRYVIWCYLWSMLGTILTIFGLITVFSLRPDVQRQEKTYYAAIDTNMTLECTVTSIFPLTIVYWKRIVLNRLTIVPYTEVKRSCTTTTAQLATQLVAGKFRCFAKNFVGTGQSLDITLVQIKDAYFLQNRVGQTEMNATSSDIDPDQNHAGQTEMNALSSGVSSEWQSQSLSERLEDQDWLKEIDDAVFHTKKQRWIPVVVSLFVSAVVNVVPVILIGLFKCPCTDGSRPAAIIEVGVATCYIIVAIVLYKMIDDKRHWLILLVLLCFTTHLLLFLPLLLYKLVLKLCCKKTAGENTKPESN